MERMTSGEIRRTSSSIPARIFSAFRIIADEAVRSGDALPMTMVPSESSAATTGLSVLLDIALAAVTVLLYSMDSPAFFRISSDLNRASSSTLPSRRSLRAAK